MRTTVSRGTRCNRRRMDFGRQKLDDRKLEKRCRRVTILLHVYDGWLFVLLVLVARWRRNAGPCGLPGLLVRNRGKQSCCCFRVVKNTPMGEAGQVGICTVRAFDSACTRFRRGFHRPLPPFLDILDHPPPTHAATQVFDDTWSVIVTLRPETFAVLVARFEGMQLPPYRGDSCVDSRDLCYDPRGWWRHAPALITDLPKGRGRLHRLARGISSTGLPWGAGSLNEPLAEGKVDERPCSGGGRVIAGERSIRDRIGHDGWGLGRLKEGMRVLVRALVARLLRVERQHTSVSRRAPFSHHSSALNKYVDMTPFYRPPLL